MSSVDLVQQALMEGLLRGELTPGTWLRQAELADRHGVSTVPVREALQRLVGLGLLQFVPNRGAVVPRLSRDDAQEQYALRRGLEPQLLRRAMSRMTIVHVAEAELALDAPDMTLTEANWVFHRALYRAAGWRRALSIVEIMHAAVAPYVLLYTQGLGAGEASHEQHLSMLDACRSGDADRAVAVLMDHLDEAAEALLVSLNEDG